MSSWLRRWYGAGPLHLAAVGGGFAVSAYAAWRLVPRDPLEVGVWIMGAPLLHDLILVPVYTAFVVLVPVVGRVRSPRALNHLRVPAMLSGALFLVFFPLILRRPPSYEGVTGYTTAPYLGRWLGLTAGLFAVSGLLYLVRSRRPARRPS